MTGNAVNWKDLRPAVQLAIIGRMSEDYSMTKVYDFLGLYAQDVGEVKRLVAQYNHQNEMEDYLTFWMQKDQLNGILRTDHTSSFRGSPEAYQGFQTQSYLKKIQIEVDESLLHATRAEVHLGKRFLAQQGIQQDMVGHWGRVSEYTYAAYPFDRKIQFSVPPLPDRSDLDSGCVSSTTSPTKVAEGQEAGAVLSSSAQIEDQAENRTEIMATSGPKKTRNSGPSKMPAPGKRQRGRQCNSPCSRYNTSSPVDDASTAGSRSRSRRNVRPTPRYKEAISVLKLRGSGSEQDSDDGMSDNNDKVSGETKPLIPSPRLRITSDNRLIGIPAPSSISMNTPGSITGTRQPSLELPNISPGDSTTPKRTASPLPLPRAVVRPPKTMPKPKQANPVAQMTEGPVMNKFKQGLLGIPREGKDFTKSLLNASAQDTENATPWKVAPHQQFAQSTFPSVDDQRRRPETLVAPAFSPISERFPGISSQEYQGEGMAVHSSPGASLPVNVDLVTDETVMKCSHPATPEFTSTPVSESPCVTRNDRSIVTETGSPIPSRRQSTSTALPLARDVVVNSHHDSEITNREEPAFTAGHFTQTQQQTAASGNISRKLDPVTGNIIFDNPDQQAPPPTALANKQPLYTSSPSRPHPLTALQEAGDDVKKAATTLKKVATSLAKTKLPAAAAATKPNLITFDATSASASAPQKPRAHTPKAPKTPTSLDGSKEKRKYGKSEAQRQKEADRTERVEREKRVKEERVREKEKEREAEAKRGGCELRDGKALMGK